jgi:hypothetical protein
VRQPAAIRVGDDHPPIPVRTFSDWNDPVPGFIEADLVSHSGPVPSGSFTQTLVLTDIATGWTDFAPVVVREQHLVVEVLGEIRRRLPIPLLGFGRDRRYGKRLLSLSFQAALTVPVGRPSLHRLIVRLARALGQSRKFSFAFQLRCFLGKNYIATSMTYWFAVSFCPARH